MPEFRIVMCGKSVFKRETDMFSFALIGSSVCQKGRVELERCCTVHLFLFSSHVDVEQFPGCRHEENRASRSVQTSLFFPLGRQSCVSGTISSRELLLHICVGIRAIFFSSHIYQELLCFCIKAKSQVLLKLISLKERTKVILHLTFIAIIFEQDLFPVSKLQTLS